MYSINCNYEQNAW